MTDVSETRFGCVLYGTDNPIVIGVGGYKTSGKDAFAEPLAVGRHFVRRGMSDPLLEWTLEENPWIRLTEDDPVDLLMKLVPLTELCVESRHGAHAGWLIRAKVLVETVGYDEAKRIREYREYLMLIGTNAGRNIIHEDVWASVAGERIMADLAFNKSVVITGIRYPNELEMIHDLGGIAVWIDRPEATKAHEAGLAAHDMTSEHSSEVSLTAADFDRVVANDGSLEDLAAKAVALADEVAARAGEQ